MKKYSLKDFEALLDREGLLVKGLGDPERCPEDSVSGRTVEYITYDSRQCRPGTVFVCKGVSFKAAYLDKAFENGAFCYVSEVEYPGGRPALIVKDVRFAMALLANMFFCTEDRSFKLIGLTGTKGKSTTLYFMKSIMDRYYASIGSKKPGYISTIDTYDGKDEFESHLTTPEALVLHEHFANAQEAGLPVFMMEVSSQGLKYDRVYGVKYDLGAFLNYGIDHVGDGEHTDEEDYIQSKLKFFDCCKKVYINLDTERIEDIIRAARISECEAVPYSVSGRAVQVDVDDYPTVCMPEYTACNIRKEEGYTWFTVKRGDEEVITACFSIPGSFNVENAMIACLLCLDAGIPKEAITEGLKDARVKGRMELFESSKKDVVVVSDYAHNILSFDRLFSAVKEDYPGWRVEALFGCPGGKGLSRRQELPGAVAKYADFVWVTEEDPGLESAADISAELEKNLAKHGCPCTVILDREEAVKTAILGAAPKTVIVMTGKGREEYMHRGNAYEPIESDSSMAEKYLAMRG